MFAQNLTIAHPDHLFARETGDITIALVDHHVLVLIIEDCKRTDYVT